MISLHARRLLTGATTLALVLSIPTVSGAPPRGQPVDDRERALPSAVAPGTKALTDWLREVLSDGDAALSRGKFTEASMQFRSCVAIAEGVPGAERHLVKGLFGLAYSLHFQGRHDEAVAFARRALTIDEKVAGTDRPGLAIGLGRLAWLHQARGKPAEAEPLYRRALSISEKCLGPEHPDVARCLNNLSAVLIQQGKLSEAEPLTRRSLLIAEKVLGPDHPAVAANLAALGEIRLRQGRFQDAEPLFKRSLGLTERSLGPESPAVLSVLVMYAGMLRQTHRDSEAANLEARARKIRARAGQRPGSTLGLDEA